MLLNGLNEPQPQANDRQELARFLVEHKISFEDVNLVVPPAYEEALREALPETVEGEVTEIQGDREAS